MGSSPQRAARVLTFLAFAAGASRAEAMDPPPDGASFDEVRAYENRLRPFTVLADVTMVLDGHFSFEGQFVPWMHHAFRLNPYCTLVDNSLWFVPAPPDDRVQLKCGGELGYRYYTGERGANGFFVGPSLVFGHTHVAGGVDASNTPKDPINFYSAGGVLDVGVQGMVETGLTVGGGGGVGLSRSLDSGARFGVDTRVFIDVGYSFP